MQCKGEEREVSNQEPKAQGDCAYNRTIEESNILAEPIHGPKGSSTQLERREVEGKLSCQELGASEMPSVRTKAFFWAINGCWQSEDRVAGGTLSL